MGELSAVELSVGESSGHALGYLCVGASIHEGIKQKFQRLIFDVLTKYFQNLNWKKLVTFKREGCGDGGGGGGCEEEDSLYIAK